MDNLGKEMLDEFVEEIKSCDKEIELVKLGDPIAKLELAREFFRNSYQINRERKMHKSFKWGVSFVKLNYNEALK